MNKSSWFRFRVFAYVLLAVVFAYLAYSPNKSEAEEAAAESPIGLTFLGTAPEWSLVDMDGAPISAASLKGKVVVVDFWATWCPPCVKEIPGYVALQKQYEKDGLVIIGISLDRGKDAEKKVRDFAAKYQVNYPLALGDSDIVDTFASIAGPIQAIPTTFLIDREGNVVHHKVGSMETADYEQLIRAALN